MTKTALDEGTRVRTADGDGTVVMIWSEGFWVFGSRRRQTWITVELDGGEGWRRIYRPAELEAVEE